MKPVIGIIPVYDTENNCICMSPGYIKGIEFAGGVPIVLPFTDDENIIKEFDKQCDGYLFTGGNDISPSLYGEENRYAVNVSKTRDNLEKLVYALAKEKDKPLLGICRGMQMINILEGGTLYQDLLNEHEGSANHVQNEPFDVPYHQEILLYESPLHKLFKTERIMVNSKHHQGIKKLGPKLSIMAMALDDLIEGIYDKKRLFMWGIQWRPDLAIEDQNSIVLFEKLVEFAGVWHDKYTTD